jgi:hypothetical protein
LFLAYRWLAYELEGSVFDISDAIKTKLIDRTFLSRALGKLTRNKWDHVRWFLSHKAPLKISSLINKRISTNKFSEDILEPSRSRLSIEAERNYILQIVRQICEVRFGKEWQDHASRSTLLTNLSDLIGSV